MHFSCVPISLLLMFPASSLYGDQLLMESRSDNSNNFNVVLRQKLIQQQMESEEDSKWLTESETQLKRLSVSQEHDTTESSLTSPPTSPSYISPATYQPVPSTASLQGNHIGKGLLHSSVGSVGSSKNHSPVDSPTNTLKGSRNDDKDDTSQSGSVITDYEKEEVAQNPTANLDRTHDRVYECTTTVVRAVMSLSQGVQQAIAEQYLDLVKQVGVELRSLLASVDNIVSSFPTQAQREVEMAHKVLSKDMTELVNAMKLAHQYSNTTLDAEYRKGMLGAAHVLAMDSKNLLDVVDSIRIRHPQVNQEVFKSNNECDPNQSVNEEKLNENLLPSLTPTAVSCTFVQTPLCTQQIQSASATSANIMDS